MSQALYRKYRSKSFNDVVGQDHVTNLLDEAVKRESISHAYLFTGPRGTGKTSVARILAHAVNKLEYSDSPHLDIIEIDAASNRRIDDIRDLRDKVHIAPTSAAYKVYIIDEVHMLTGESFNALLKTLEEPPAHVIFILATTELHKVPATIISRTQRFHFRPGSKTVITKHLLTIADKENINIEPEAAELIAEHSEGGFRDALSLLDQIATKTDQVVDRERVENLLGVAPRHTITSIVEAMLIGDIGTVTSELKNIHDTGTSPIVVADQLNREIASQAMAHPELYQVLDELIDIQRSSAPELKLLAVIAKHTAQASSTTNQSKKPTIATSSRQDKIVASRQVDKSKDKKLNKKTTSSDMKSEATKDSSDGQPQQTTAINDHSEEAGEPLAWEEVLVAVQKKAPALYGVLKRAEAECSSAQITLTFQYALHRKKLSDARYRSQLASIIENIFNCKPDIIITDQTEKPISTEVSTVIDIMGGGKPVNA